MNKNNIRVGDMVINTAGTHILSYLIIGLIKNRYHILYLDGLRGTILNAHLYISNIYKHQPIKI